jgi:hypothetical protein
MLETTLRNANLSDLAELLQNQETQKVDIVAPAGTISSENGLIYVDGADAVINEDGVTQTSGIYSPTAIFDEGLAGKLNIPVGYLRRMRAERIDLYDANVNGWLSGGDEPMDKSFLIRAFSSTSTSDGIARAFLSDSYKRMDNLDILTSALMAVRKSDYDVQVESCDLTERNMRVILTAPEITASAEVLLQNYRSPFSGAYGKDNPLISAGLVIKNSETGNGAFSIAPHFVVQVCNNGMTMTTDAQRNVHLGGKLDDGVIRWSAESNEAALKLVQAKTVDCINTFLDVDYLKRSIHKIEAKSGQPLNGPADKVITKVCKALTFDEDTTAGVLEHFIKGADATAGGVMQAVTSYAQVLTDPDAATYMEESAFKALELASA